MNKPLASRCIRRLIGGIATFLILATPARGADLATNPATGPSDMRQAFAEQPVPVDAAQAFANGQGHMAAGDALAGFTAFAQALKAQPDNMIYQTYTLAYLDRLQYSQDLAIHQAMLDVYPDYVPVIGRTARLLEGKGDNAGAEMLYRRWVELRPDQAEPYARLGEHYFFNQRYDQAITAFETHRKLVGESDYALRRLAAVYHETGDYLKAERLWAMATDIVRIPGKPTVAIAMADPDW